VTPDRPAGSTGAPIVLVVGAASRDVAGDDPRGWRLGGAVNYVSLILARLGVSVRALVGVDGHAARAAELDDLRAAGADVALARLQTGPVFDNIETPEGRRQHCLAASDPVELTALPRAWTMGFDALVLAPVAGELNERWAILAAGDRRPAVALGWQGLLRRLRAGSIVERTAPDASALVRAAHLVIASEEDFAPGTDPRALGALLAPASTLVVTTGGAGGLVLGAVDATGVRAVDAYPAIPSDGVIDPTGAGDVFLGAMLAARLQPSLGDPITAGAAAASLAVEGPGLAGVPDLAATRARMTRAPSLASRRPSAVSNRTSGRPSHA
jgi:sugar/nucleoside kinase (ribokinase family)